MKKLSGFNYKELIFRLKFFGFELKRQSKGSHEFWYNPKTNKFTTIPNHSGKNIKEGTLRAILKQAGIKNEDFLK